MRPLATILAGIVMLVAGTAYAADDLEVLLSQLAALQSQLAKLQEKSVALPGVRVCAAPQRTLAREAEGDDVANLQIFLARETGIYPEGSITGYFGPATERAVQRWQKEHDIVASGTPATTGYGLVGARTRTAMQHLWNCRTAATLGWFTASAAGATISFSAQISSDVPLDTWPYIETGDGGQERVHVSSVVCKSYAGPCSTVVTAQHTYTSGTYRARLIRPSSETTCLPGDLSSCSLSQNVHVLGSADVAVSRDAVSGTTLASATTSSAGTDRPSTSTTQTTTPAVPSVRVLAPVRGVATRPGSTLTISWTSPNAHASSSVSILLRRNDGTPLGAIVRAQRIAGSYLWALPVAGGSTCNADPITCLLSLASPPCSGDICSVPVGEYRIVAQLISSAGRVLASAESDVFTVSASGAPSAITSLPDTTGTGSDTTGGTTGSLPGYTAIPGPDAVTNPHATCMYSGVSYPHGVTLQVSCNDMAGISCGNFGMLSLTCEDGSWVDGDGRARNDVPGVSAPVYSGASCTTPWGSQKVFNGQQITYEPFFTAGQHSGLNPMPLMMCKSGQWQKCKWDGTSCQPFTVI